MHQEIKNYHIDQIFTPQFKIKYKFQWKTYQRFFELGFDKAMNQETFLDSKEFLNLKNKNKPSFKEAIFALRDYLKDLEKTLGE
jgi:hypothetical protein